MVAAMRNHAGNMAVLGSGTEAVANICEGDGWVAGQRRKTAVDAGATGAVVAAMRSHAGDMAVLGSGAKALASLCEGDDAAAAARRRTAAGAGAIQAVLAAVPPGHAAVQDACASLLALLLGLH